MHQQDKGQVRCWIGNATNTRRGRDLAMCWEWWAHSVAARMNGDMGMPREGSCGNAPLLQETRQHAANVGAVTQHRGCQGLHRWHGG
jgi:hypothetical protein